MRLVNYSLEIGNKKLFDNVSIEFKKGAISHLLGSNGVGKSCFAKSIIKHIKYSGKIETKESVILIGSYTGVPQDLSILNIKKVLEKNFSKKNIQKLSELLNLELIDNKLHINKMSDGQKQKIKLLSFLVPKPEIIILDEFTSAIDKSSCMGIYNFLEEYILINGTTVINITHNLTDVEKMKGDYYYINNKKIQKIENKDRLFELYING